MLIRIVALAVLTAVVGLAPAGAEEGAAPAGRYTIAPSDQGFVRMDTRTGSTSHCSRKDAVWLCEPIADVGARIEDRVEAIAAALVALEVRVGELASKIARSDQPAAETLTDPEAGRAGGFATTVIDRFVGMVRKIKKGGREES